MNKQENHIIPILYWLVIILLISTQSIVAQDNLPPIFRIDAEQQQCVDYESLQLLDTYTYQQNIIIQFIHQAIPLDSCAKQLTVDIQTIADVPDSLLLNNKSLPYDIQPVQRETSTTFIFYLFLLITGIVAYTRTAYKNYTKKIDESFWNISLAKQFFRDYNHTNPLLNTLLSVNIILITSLLAYLTIKYFNKLPNLSNHAILLVTTIITTLYILGRRVLLRGAAVVLPLPETIKFYLFNLKILNTIIVLTLLLPLIAFAFAPEPFKTGALVIVLSLLMLLLISLIYRGVVIAEKIVSLYKFHFFLYLCSFELLPIIILFKLVELYIY